MAIGQKEFTNKKKELDELAQSIDLWLATPMAPAKKERVLFLIEELQNRLNELDDRYLETKLASYREIYQEIKKFEL